MNLYHITSALMAPAAVCVAVTAACTTLRPVGADELRGPNTPTRARVTLRDNSTIDLKAPKVVGDTLVGSVDGVPQFLPLSQTTDIQALEPAPQRTAEFVWSGVVVAFALLVIETTKSPMPTPSGPCAMPGTCVPAVGTYY